MPSPSQVRWRLASLVAVALSGLARAVPSVLIGMSAAFPASPYLLQLVETAAGENETCYFPLLDRIADGYFDAASTDQALYESILNVLPEIGCIVHGDALSTFKLALSLQAAAPRIEAHYQYYVNSIEPRISVDCTDSFVTFGNRTCCNTDIYCTAPITEAMRANLLPFDRSIGSTESKDQNGDVVLYTDLTTPSFRLSHRVLIQEARMNKISYRVRYKKSASFDAVPQPLSGYGVELALKKTDYIVIDDRDATPETDDQVEGQQTILNTVDDPNLADLKPLSTSELFRLGLKTASYIMQENDPFDALLTVTQDFPKFSSAIATHGVYRPFLEEHEHNRYLFLPSGLNLAWINGVQLSDRQIEPFILIDMIRRERMLIKGMQDFGLGPSNAIKLLSHHHIASAKSEGGPLRFDWTDEPESGRLIIWMNDIETDSRYSNFSPELRSLLARTFPGQLPFLRRNLFHLILPLDLTNGTDITALFNILKAVEGGVTIRFGFIPIFPTSLSADQGKVVYHLLHSYGIDAVYDYLKLFQLGKNSDERINDILLGKAIGAHSPLKKSHRWTVADVLESPEYGNQITRARHWAERLGANASRPIVLLDGAAIPRDEGWLSTFNVKLQADLQLVREAVLAGELQEDMWLPAYFLKNAYPRRNPYVFPSDLNPLVVRDIGRLYRDHAKLFSQLPVIEAHSDSSRESWAVLTVIADLDTRRGRELLLSALEFRRQNPGIRLDVIHNPLIHTRENLDAFIAKLKRSEERLAAAVSLEELDAILDHDQESREGDRPRSYQSALKKFMTELNQFAGESVLLLNGRVVGPLLDADIFSDQEFNLLLDFERQTRILPVFAALDDLAGTGKPKLDGPLTSAKLTSVVACSTISNIPRGVFQTTPVPRTGLFNNFTADHSSIKIGDPFTSSVHLVFSLDPASETGQKWAPILHVLSRLEGVYVQIFLNPKEHLAELPVKRFYRYVSVHEPRFDMTGRLQPLRAVFTGLPSEALLTAAVDVPPAWLVAPKDSVQDLDNILLSSVRSDIEATYELQNILIDGHARDNGGLAPRGTQLVLGTDKTPHLTDTIVMENIGFFQFKANPGYYAVHLMAGRSSEIYDIVSIGASGWLPVPGDEGVDVVLMNFQGTTLYPRLQRKVGMEDADVRVDPVAEGTGTKRSATDGDGLMSRGLRFAESLFGSGPDILGNKSATTGAEDGVRGGLVEGQAEINIFSVASGHLYERMLNIMMVSVMRHTKHTVKFWFIEQFLSPSFKEFIPLLADEYGFRYEMVTYKWPHWLRGQKEKQREIWGYKILFLDVLFPLSLDKVIFVDADQIVRTDMIDLVRLDLAGAPYGFTPMCDSRAEMEGFRFWKNGYWASFLRGRPYHISALYVVDLVRFRQLGAGDRLRQQYHTLSADPGSLANLDQDLPNNMQFQIPIFSLPPDWLWCETWCADAALATARTIDLCNNPLTKEPKLDRARRQIPEWTLYDDEIAALQRRTRTHTPAAGHDADLPSPQPTNPKSRRMDAEPESRTRVKDEL